MIEHRKVLAFSASIEAATGLGFIAGPALVTRLLLGDELTGPGLIVGRAFGVALLSLSLAVWPRGPATAQACRAMALYNAGLAIYLAWLGAAVHVGGPLLWPAALIHAIVAVLLARPLRSES